ncbi:nucleotide exchange factor GrpE [Bacillus timonensis]|uniref:Nucleotide exchange factor GrpE n=1 Tax=Bacillus timonensis TaxID=1033734 RepID=A0A4V3V7Q4_9BACI|nr:nucleotide exchange factor GrpE [Bacillus timonensis]THE12323.1 nucleotide exchange factor GrpE [Bacillus timonensis]
MSSRTGPEDINELLELMKKMSPEDIEKERAEPIIKVKVHYHYNNLRASTYYRPRVIPIIPINQIKQSAPKQTAKQHTLPLDVAKSILAYHKLVSKLVIFTLFKLSIDAIDYFKISIKYDVESSDFPIEKWEKELDSMKQQLINKLPIYFEEGEGILSATIQEILEREKESLQPLEEFHYNPGATQPTFLVKLQESLAELQEQIKGDFKNSNRITYKLMQEFQQQLEEFGQISDDDQGSKIEEIKNESIKNMEKMKRVAIEIFDMLDLVYQSTLQVNETKWTSEIEKAINKVISILESHGIVEIPVMGQLLDGKTMECIGTVSQHEVQVPMEKYQVFAVHQRGFLDKNTGKILRKASVTSVL